MACGTYNYEYLLSGKLVFCEMKTGHADDKNMSTIRKSYQIDIKNIN